MTDAWIFDHVRTPRGRGKSDGALHEVTPVQLAAQALAALRDRNGLDTALVDAKGRLRAEADFLRFTLSDGAGAIVIEPEPRPGALKIGFIDIVSLADRFDPCMWAGATFETRSDLTRTWSHLGPRVAHEAGPFHGQPSTLPRITGPTSPLGLMVTFSPGDRNTVCPVCFDVTNALP